MAKYFNVRMKTPPLNLEHEKYHHCKWYSLPRSEIVQCLDEKASLSLWGFVYLQSLRESRFTTPRSICKLIEASIFTFPSFLQGIENNSIQISCFPSDASRTHIINKFHMTLSIVSCIIKIWDSIFKPTNYESKFSATSRLNCFTSKQIKNARGTNEIYGLI